MKSIQEFSVLYFSNSSVNLKLSQNKKLKKRLQGIDKVINAENASANNEYGITLWM